MIERLCVIGVGLIGGSIARAARAKGLARTVVGVDADGANLNKALASGVIGQGYSTVAQGAADADMVVMAVPVGVSETVLRELQAVWSDQTIYTDAGSTKGDVIAAVARVFGAVPANFVPGHPIAGAECSGVEASRADLYEGKRVILTPLDSTDPEATARVEALWQGMGAKVSRMDARHHDEVLAATSHLPHVLAFVLTEMLGRQDEQREIFQYAAGGFRDFTRIASSDPKMWLDICLANRAEIVPLIEQYRTALANAAALMSEGRAEALYDLFASARGARQRFLDQLEK
ncbi:prephenate dehydrogenase [Methylomagnum sp.]